MAALVAAASGREACMAGLVQLAASCLSPAAAGCMVLCTGDSRGSLCGASMWGSGGWMESCMLCWKAAASDGRVSMRWIVEAMSTDKLCVAGVAGDGPSIMARRPAVQLCN
jgi:hypothetical protein